jgi:hypothetical protein
MGWDSNPRTPYEVGSFQDCCLKPLGHPSGQETRRNFNALRWSVKAVCSVITACAAAARRFGLPIVGGIGFRAAAFRRPRPHPIKSPDSIGQTHHAYATASPIASFCAAGAAT